MITWLQTDCYSKANTEKNFRKRHSTELAALELTDRIRREMDQNRIPFSIFLDLRGQEPISVRNDH